MEMPQNMIIIISIVAVVLVVLAGALTQSGKASCEQSGGFCASYCSQGFTELQFSCPSEISSCCIEVSPHNKIEIIEGDLFP